MLELPLPYPTLRSLHVAIEPPVSIRAIPNADRITLRPMPRLRRLEVWVLVGFPAREALNLIFPRESFIWEG